MITYSIFWMVLLAGAENTMASAADTLTVKVTGFHEDSRFEPSDLTISAGDVIRFNVVEGIHTVTAYHPDNRKPLRIPERAESFDSGPLQAGDEWHLQIKVPGEYN
ncbi:MAG: hypothetical protein WD139_13690, partial [Balneolaceae bacterium]